MRQYHYPRTLLDDPALLSVWCHHEKEHHEKILSNRVAAQGSEKIACANCGERLVFAMRDSHGNEFSVGLSVVLQCLRQAESEQYVPKLPIEWWRNILSEYEV